MGASLTSMTQNWTKWTQSIPGTGRMGDRSKALTISVSISMALGLVHNHICWVIFIYTRWIGGRISNILYINTVICCPQQHEDYNLTRKFNNTTSSNESAAVHTWNQGLEGQSTLTWSVNSGYKPINKCLVRYIKYSYHS